MLDGSSSATTERLRGVRVLIVEDSWYIAGVIESVLEEVGMVIAGAAATTTDAERLASESTPSVAVVDVKLRDGMAFDLIEQLHELGVRVVVVSGFTTFSTSLAKAAVILQKRFDGRELLGALARALLITRCGEA